ncbi:hypothetical protein Glove_624g29 [Diversispora epigaea]|uniref:Protein kinase domain-containing protein n=1 Tax=Diversispora epigaea TaxID=1348612 RepID=A0A397G8Y5_9GLOM|nr:hypothetical protein Glove_624g29 [Diversispora epigaea]
MRKSEEIKDTGETEEMEVKEIDKMKGTRKTEEMKDIEETKELEESENFEDKGTCNECHQNNIGFNWCHPCNAKKFQNEFGKWTSEDREIDEFIQQIQLNANKHQEIIEWIPFDKLENVTYLAKGGFSTVYKANWLDGFIYYWKYKIEDWKRSSKRDVCLKSFDNSTNKNEFLQEIKNQLKFRGKNAIAIYGITKNPSKNEYMMVMDYVEYGSLREMLNTKFGRLTWKRKYNILLEILVGLTNIHEMGLMHKDFHSGNIVNRALILSYITDFGLCKPVTEKDPENIYGVIPYMAPETLSRGEYTQASDIYSFGMVMLEVLTSYPPYYNIPHDVNLVMKICKGLKPEIKCEIPQFLKEIMEKCWNFEPLERSTVAELRSQLEKYLSDDYEIIKEVNNQVQAANRLNKNFVQYDSNEMHPEAIYTSRLISKFTIPECDTFTEYDTYNSRQQLFSIPDNIIVKDEENETQETEWLKPEIKCEIPQFLKEIMEKCWNFEPLERSTVAELRSQLEKYLSDDYEIIKEVNNQVQAANRLNKNFVQYDSNEMHPEAIYTSRLISKFTIPECDTFTEYDTYNSRQQLFSIPDNIIVKDEENETQETESKSSSSVIWGKFICKQMQINEHPLPLNTSGAIYCQVSQKRVIIKRSKDVQEKINEKRRVVDKATEILRPLFNSRQNKMTFTMPPPISEPLFNTRQNKVTFARPPPISEVRIKQRKGRKASDGSDRGDGSGGGKDPINFRSPY